MTKSFGKMDSEFEGERKLVCRLILTNVIFCRFSLIFNLESYAQSILLVTTCANKFTVRCALLC